MKIGGFVMVWNEIEYLKPMLEQAQEFCDYIVVAEGCHMPNKEPRSTDGTVEYLEQFDFDTIEVHNKENLRYDYYQCQILNTAYDMMIEEGCEWIRDFDADMVFKNSDLELIKNKMKNTTKNCLTFNERRFFGNFKWNTTGKTGFFYRAIPNMYLTPIAVVHEPSGIRQRDGADHMDITCFHMCAAKKDSRMKPRYEMSAEKGTPNAMDNYERWKNIDIKNPDPREVEYIIGGEQFNEFKGDLPEVLQDHPWKDVEDIRWMDTQE